SATQGRGGKGGAQQPEHGRDEADAQSQKTRQQQDQQQGSIGFFLDRRHCWAPMTVMSSGATLREMVWPRSGRAPAWVGRSTLRVRGPTSTSSVRVSPR